MNSNMADEELISHALTLWANHIETGQVTLSANDVAEQNRSMPAMHRRKLPVLHPDQAALVNRLRGLAVDQGRETQAGRSADRLR